MSILDRCESREGKKVRLLAVHSTEGNGTAQALRDAAWWEGSSHAINDEAGTLLTPEHGCVPYDMAAWTIRSGNLITENIEQVGWAKWTRADWLARPKLLDTTALWLADRARARGIPLVKLSPADVKAGKSGVIGHVDWTVGMADGSHSDPGPGYPWDVVLGKANWLLNPTPATPPAAPVVQAPREAIRMRSVQLTADQPTAVLTVDPVAKSYVMPPGSRAWCQAAAFFPGSEATKARVSWLVFLNGEGKDTKVFSPFNLTHRQGFGGPDFELPPGTDRVEIRVEGIPAGGVIGVHIDGLGHA